MLKKSADPKPYPPVRPIVAKIVPPVMTKTLASVAARNVGMAAERAKTALGQKRTEKFNANVDRIRRKFGAEVIKIAEAAEENIQKLMSIEYDACTEAGGSPGYHSVFENPKISLQSALDSVVEMREKAEDAEPSDPDEDEDGEVHVDDDVEKDEEDEEEDEKI
jgi:hypothetical protein